MALSSHYSNWVAAMLLTSFPSSVTSRLNRSWSLRVVLGAKIYGFNCFYPNVSLSTTSAPANPVPSQEYGLY